MSATTDRAAHIGRFADACDYTCIDRVSRVSNFFQLGLPGMVLTHDVPRVPSLCVLRHLRHLVRAQTGRRWRHSQILVNANAMAAAEMQTAFASLTTIPRGTGRMVSATAVSTIIAQ